MRLVSITARMRLDLRLRRERWDAANKVSLAVQEVWSSEEPGVNLMMTKLENTRRDLARSRTSRRGLEYEPGQVKRGPGTGNEFGQTVLMCATAG